MGSAATRDTQEPRAKEGLWVSRVHFVRSRRVSLHIEGLAEGQAKSEWLGGWSIANIHPVKYLECGTMELQVDRQRNDKTSNSDWVSCTVKNETTVQNSSS